MGNTEEIVVQQSRIATWVLIPTLLLVVNRMKQLLFFLIVSCSLFSYEVVSYGDAIIDYVVFVDEDAIEGPVGGSAPVDFETFQRLTRNYHRQCAGGSATNTTKGLASFGRDCAMIGRIGNDGHQYLQSLQNFLITPLLSQYDSPSGQMACLVTPDGQRTMRGYIGALYHCHPFPVDPTVFEGAKIFHIEGYQIPNAPFLKELISLAKREGALISMDMGCCELVKLFQEDLLDIIENDLDIIFCNIDEAKTLTGQEPEKASKLLAEKCRVAVVTAGAKGGYVSSGDESFHYPAVCVKSIDETGAGDLFMAGFLHAYLEGKALYFCANHGAKLASQIVQIEGAELSQPQTSCLYTNKF
jgi:sugar/nucleoside kinase (ribokinase family)